MAGEKAPDEQPPRKRRRRPRRRKPAGTGTPASTGATPGAPARSAKGSSSGTSRRRSSKGGSGKATPPKKKVTTKRARRIPTQREVSAGGVLYRVDDGGGIEVVLASRRTRRGDLAWGLAKGGIEPGETREEAAIREVREETGLEAEIEADLGDTKYIYVWEDVRIRKTVHFFLMRHTGGDVDDRDDEMEEIRWFPMERARKRAAYRGERDVLARAAELLG
jgi:8-oxo-dGTP pyrophosphatase MutT (NUDIX family)